jgi:hypothetical protein
MKNNRVSNFSQIVCSTEPVREAFALHHPMNTWWRVILSLHGKPIPLTLSPEQQTKRITDGFRFYASLYRGLGLIFLILSPVLVALPVTETGPSAYFATASLLAGLYLWVVSGFGYSATKSYVMREKRGAVALISFMVMIVAFLSLFVGAMCVSAQYSSPLPTSLNLAMAGTLFIFGVGSYMIEIVYLATENIKDAF